MYDLPTMEDLKRERTGAGLTQAELASRAGVSQSLIARIERGDVDPRLSTFGKILKALKEAKGRKGLLAGNIMRSPVIYVGPKETLGAASKLMVKHDISQMPVIEKGIQIGSLSERKVVREIHSEDDLAKVSASRVEEIMGQAFPTVDKNTDIQTLSTLVESKPALLVVDRGKPVGIVTKTDVLRLMKK